MDDVSNGLEHLGHTRPTKAAQPGAPNTTLGADADERRYSTDQDHLLRHARLSMQHRF